MFANNQRADTSANINPNRGSLIFLVMTFPQNTGSFCLHLFNDGSRPCINEGYAGPLGLVRCFSRMLQEPFDGFLGDLIIMSICLPSESLLPPEESCEGFGE